MPLNDSIWMLRDKAPRVLIPLLFLAMALVLLPFAGQLGPKGLLALAVTVLLYIGILTNIHLGLGLLVVCFGLSPEFQMGGVSNLRLEDLFIPAVLLAWLTRMTLRQEPPEKTDLKFPIVILMTLSAISSLLNFSYRGLPLLTSILFFGKTVEYYLIFLVVMNVVKTKREVMGYTFLMIAVSLAGGILGLGMFLAPGAGPRLTGPPGETANIFGGYLAFHMMLAVGMAICVPVVWSRVLLSGYLVANMIPMLYTYSRTTFAAFFGGLVSLAFLRQGRALIGVAIFVILLPVVFPDQAVDRIETIFQIFSDDKPSSWQARVDAWNTFGGLILESPLIGRGLASAPLGYIDNEYVKQANELGLFGLLTFFWLLLRIFRTALRAVHRAQDPQILGFCTGFAAGFAAILIHNLGATSLTSIRIAEPFFFATGLLYAVKNHMLDLEEAPDQATAPAGERERPGESDAPRDVPAEEVARP